MAPVSISWLTSECSDSVSPRTKPVVSVLSGSSGDVCIAEEVHLPGEFYRQRKLVGYSPWGGKESDIADRLTLSLTKSLQMVTAAMKLEDACSLAEKL